MRIGALVATAFALSAFIPAARAQFDLDPIEGEEKNDEKPAKTGISTILGELDWGDTHREVIVQAKAEIDAAYADDFKRYNGDTLQTDRLMRARRKDYKKVDENYIEFKGPRTGYESSVIAQEYKPNAGESMVRIDDDRGQRYYFFKDGKLWKIVVAQNNAKGETNGFAGFVKQIQRKYGRPTRVDWEGEGSGRVMAGATWEDPNTRLVVRDQSAFFGTYSLKYLDLAAGVRIEESRPERRDGDRTAVDDRQLSDTMAEITGETVQETDDIVDRLTGVRHDVNLDRGRPEYEVLDPSAAAAKAKRDEKREADKDSGGKSAKKKKKNNKVDTPPEDPGIVY